MAKIMLFKRGLHSKELDMRFMDDSEQKGTVEKFKAAGYVENPPLVTMYNPQTKEQLTIHAEDQSILELRGFFANPTWVYHPSEAPTGKIVSNAEAQQLFSNGYYSNPSMFPGNQLGITKAKSTLIMPKGNVA